MITGLTKSVGQCTPAAHEMVMASTATHGVLPDLETKFFRQAGEKRTIEVVVSINL
jgi:hypothetical protein